MIRIIIEIDGSHQTVNVQSDKELMPSDKTLTTEMVDTTSKEKEPPLRGSYKTKIGKSTRGNWPESWDAVVQRFIDRFIPFTLKDIAGPDAKPQHKSAIVAYLKTREDITITQFDITKHLPYKFYPVRYENGKQIIASDDPPLTKNVIKGSKVTHIKKQPTITEEDLQQA